jgi:hypothetical protein
MAVSKRAYIKPPQIYLSLPINEVCVYLLITASLANADLRSIYLELPLRTNTNLVPIKVDLKAKPRSL